MTINITIQIGNSDNKLSQIEWSEFVSKMHKAIDQSMIEIHFFGGSINWARWQNVCWIFEIDKSEIPNLRSKVIEIRDYYKQDSVCWSEGNIEFI